MKITIEVNGYRMVIGETDLEHVSFRVPRDVHTDAVGHKTLGKAHVYFSGTFPEGSEPQWEAI